jgi:hypothetical protein
MATAAVAPRARARHAVANMRFVLHTRAGFRGPAAAGIRVMGTFL